MSRKGFVDPVLLGAGALILVCLVVLGFSLYHFRGTNLSSLVPHVPSISTSSTQQASTTSVAVVKTPTTTQAKASSVSGSCSTSMNCFITAAQKCSPATVSFTGTIDVSALFAESVKSQLAIKGLNSSGKCIFSDDAISAKGIVTPQFLSGAEAQGLTAAQAQQEVQGEANQSAGQTSQCTFTPSALVSLLTDWSKGPINVSAFTPGNCTSNSTPTNTNINVTTPPASAPEQVYGGTATLTAPGNFGYNNLKFNVAAVYSASANMTVSNSATGQSATVSLNLNQPMTVVGYTMTVTNITMVESTNAQGQNVFSNKATLTFKQQ